MTRSVLFGVMNPCSFGASKCVCACVFWTTLRQEDISVGTLYCRSVCLELYMNELQRLSQSTIQVLLEDPLSGTIFLISSPHLQLRNVAHLMITIILYTSIIYTYCVPSDNGKSPFFSGKPRYVNGHFQYQTVELPEGRSPNGSWTSISRCWKITTSPLGKSNLRLCQSSPNPNPRCFLPFLVMWFYDICVILYHNHHIYIWLWFEIRVWIGPRWSGRLERIGLRRVHDPDLAKARLSPQLQIIFLASSVMLE